MTQTEVGRSYREAAIRGASSVECVIMMYDMVVADLRKITEYLSRGDVEGRSAAAKHCLAVLGELQANLQLDSGGEAARDLDNLYSLARAKVLEGQIKRRAVIFEEIAAAMLEVRALWVEVQKSCLDEVKSTPIETPAGWAVTADEPVVKSAWSA